MGIHVCYFNGESEAGVPTRTKEPTVIHARSSPVLAGMMEKKEMLYLIALFISPLALLLAGKPFQAVINLVIYILAFIGLFVFIFPGVILWLIGVVHAFAVISSKKSDQRAQKIVDAIQREQKD